MSDSFSFFFFNDTATTEIYTLSLHDALPIYFRDPGVWRQRLRRLIEHVRPDVAVRIDVADHIDLVEQRIARSESTRLNSSHSQISYAVFCLKKKNKSKNLCRKKENRVVRTLC